jgi:hypothetical protein
MQGEAYSAWRRRPGIMLVVGLLIGALVWQAAGQIPALRAALSLARPGAVAPARPTTYPALTGLPVVIPGGPQPFPIFPGTPRNSVYAGTPGLKLPIPVDRSGHTFAILADRTAGAEWGEKYLQRSVAELNRLRPELVLCVGDLVGGYTRSGEDYARDAGAVRTILDQLTMPWYAAPGNHDVDPGTRDPSDRRFEALYQHYFGPLYYSLDYGDLHFILLDSEESLASEPLISDAQLTWLRNDLARTFENKLIAHVFVVVHKPVWRFPKANWDRVHALLTDFNRRPVVAIEGAQDGGGGNGGGGTRAARVEAVFAGHLHTYIKDPPRDGIGYYVLSVTGGMIDQDRAAGQLQSYLLVKVDAQGPHLALLEPFANEPDDFVLAADRAVLDQIAALDERQLNVVGTLDQPDGRPAGSRDPHVKPLTLVLNNPLKVPLEVSLRMASARNLITAAQREAANAATDNFDSPWELSTPIQSVTLAPGTKSSYPMSMFCLAQPSEVSPPQVEFVVSWKDSKGRVIPTVLKRRVALVPDADIALLKGPPKDKDWETAPVGRTFAFVPSPYDTDAPAPQIQFLADAGNIYLRVHAPTKRFSYFPDFSQPWNLACSAVIVSFAPTPATPAAQAQRIVVLPFAPQASGPELLTNTGVGKDQTALLPLDTQRCPVRAAIRHDADSYELWLTLPRTTLMPGVSEACVANVTIVDNDDSAHSTFRSWAREDLGPAAWGHLRIKPPLK